MSGSEERDTYRPARELAEVPGAVAALVELLDHGGSAGPDTLSSTTGSEVTDETIRWLTTANLVRRFDASSIADLDQAGTGVELTPVGFSMTTSLIELAKIYAEPAAISRHEVTITED